MKGKKSHVSGTQASIGAMFRIPQHTWHCINVAKYWDYMRHLAQPVQRLEHYMDRMSGERGANLRDGII